ncbi:MAG: NlpC/P60 family protein [Schaedlerella sp.]|nr:NlpC/P60 family protein [Schaedlerella sp.]
MENEKITRLQEKSDKINEKVEKAKDHLPKKKKAKFQRLYDEEKGKKVTKLRFEEEIVSSKDGTILQNAGGVTKKVAKSAAITVETALHGKVHEVEDENLGVKSAHQTEIVAEGSGKAILAGMKHQKKTPYEKVEKLEHRAEKMNTRLLYEKSLEENPELKKNPISKRIQKKEIKKRYAVAYKATKNGAEAVVMTSVAASEKATTFGKIKTVVSGFVRKNKAALAVLAVIGIICIAFVGAFGAMGTMLSQTGGAVVESTFLSSDDDIYAVDEAYTEMENALQQQIDGIENTYPGYDEYRYQIDEISHEPYALISYLTAKYGDFTAVDVQTDLENLFDEQYSMQVWDEVETRTKTETRTATRNVTDPETGEVTTEEYEYEVEVEYEYHILNIQVTNKGMDAIAFQELDEDGRRHYQIYLASLGNRSYLFGDRILVGNPASGGMSYDIPPEALTDQKFANMIHEAEKYLGYPYVWGGASPSTSFDCSGFVSWVINNCGNGWSYGRLTADGLRGICTYVSPADAKPGDLIFFQGTYNTAGASHVGIYVGNGMMIHCGKPIQYASIETSYWQQHFMCFGRIN